MRLSLAYGMPARQLLKLMTSADLTEMMAFYELDPFGEQRADLRHAVAMSQMYNLNRGKSPAKRATDFMLFPDKKREAYQSIQLAIRSMGVKRGN